MPDVERPQALASQLSVQVKVKKTLIVLESDVEAWPVLLNECVFKDKRFFFVIAHYRIDSCEQRF